MILKHTILINIWKDTGHITLSKIITFRLSQNRFLLSRLLLIQSRKRYGAALVIAGRIFLPFHKMFLKQAVGNSLQDLLQEMIVFFAMDTIFPVEIKIILLKFSLRWLQQTTEDCWIIFMILI